VVGHRIDCGKVVAGQEMHAQAGCVQRSNGHRSIVTQLILQHEAGQPGVSRGEVHHHLGASDVRLLIIGGLRGGAPGAVAGRRGQPIGGAEA
jgi:hypothetical protein